MPDLVINLTAPPVIRETIDQAGHGFVVGNAVRADAVANTYVKALADNEANSMAVGIVSQVVNLNQFVVTYQGRILSGVPAVSAGTIMYLSDSVAGALTSTAPAIEVPILVVSQNAVSGIVINSLQRGSGGGGGLTFAVASGTNNYTATVGATSYVAGDAYLIKFTNASTGTSQINLDGLGNKGLVKEPSVPVGSGDIVAGDTLLIVYDGTWFQAYKWSSSGIQSVTGDSVDNTDPANPVVNAIPLAGTSGGPGNQVSGDVEMDDAMNVRFYTNDGTDIANVRYPAGKVEVRVDRASGPFETVLTVEHGGMTSESDAPNYAGIQYGADYSADYTNRSLVDKEYVDNAAGGTAIVYLTRAALQALITGSTLDTTVTYAITDAVGSTAVIFVWAATNNTLHAAAIDQTNTYFGFYNIVADTFTQVYKSDFTILPLSQGGTNKNLTAANGAIPWVDADSFELLAPGSVGAPLLSGGAGAPTWGTVPSVVVDGSAAAAVTGFTGVMDANIFRYSYNPQTKECTVYCRFQGTSNATSMTCTLPFTSAAFDQFIFSGGITDNNVLSNTIGRVAILASSTTATFTINRSGGSWTAANTKAWLGSFTFFTA